MKIVYQPQVIKTAEKIIEVLTSSNFFEMNQIEDTEYAFDRFCKELTEKLIIGELHDNEPCFSVDEINPILNEIVAMNELMKLKKAGLLESYVDDSLDEEVFFLTDYGKKIADKLNKKIENDEENN